MKIIKKEPGKTGAGRPLVYPFDEIAIGQCIEMEGTYRDNWSVISAAYQYGKRNKIKFKMRSDKKKGVTNLFRTK